MTDYDELIAEVQRATEALNEAEEAKESAYQALVDATQRVRGATEVQRTARAALNDAIYGEVGEKK